METHASDLLLNLPPAEAAQILALGNRRLLKEGEVVFHLGEEATELYFVSDGRVRLTLPMRLQGGEEEVLVEERESGQILGWSALIPPFRFTLKGTAAVDTELLAVSGGELLEYLSGKPAVGFPVMSNLGGILGQRLQLFQAMWAREMQRLVEMGSPELSGEPQ